MELSKTVVDDKVAVLGCSGRLNMITASRVKSAVDACVSAGQCRIVVDLSGVDFIDSSGLGALIAGLKTSRQAGGDLRLAAAGEQVLTVLGLTNLDRILRPYATVDDAADGW
jgi:anti-sigma B factor antagonist